MPSLPEATFRLGLQDLLEDPQLVVPAGLSAALWEHLTRRDGQGHSLCFDGPERQRLLAELVPTLLNYMETIVKMT